MTGPSRGSTGVVLVACGALGGCGVMFNGFSQTVEVRTTDPEAEIFSNGALVGKGAALVSGSPLDPPAVVVRGRDGALQRATTEATFDAGFLVLDLVACATLVGIAAPIADGVFDGLRSLDGPLVVEVKPLEKRAPRVIEYGTPKIQGGAARPLTPPLASAAPTPRPAVSPAPRPAPAGSAPRPAPAAVGDGLDTVTLVAGGRMRGTVLGYDPQKGVELREENGFMWKLRPQEVRAVALGKKVGGRAP